MNMTKVSPETMARHQSLRLKRFGIAATTYVLWIILGVYLEAMGLFALSLGGLVIPMWAIIAGMSVTNVSFYYYLKSGRNLSLEDPSMSLPMMVVAMVWVIIFAGGISEARGINLITFMMVFLFGVFNLSVRQYLFCWAFAVVGYGLMVWITLPEDLTGRQLSLEIMYWVLLTVTLFWAVCFGYYVGRLRDKLSERNTELKKALTMVEEIAVRDDLTGLHNRRFLMDALTREHQRAERHGSIFSLLMLDLDDFKEINDTHGHAAGDSVLKGFVKRLQDQVRGLDLIGHGGSDEESETIGRFGGEEFLVVLPDTDGAGAKKAAERIRYAIAQTPIQTNDGPIRITVSIGVAQHQAGETVRSVLERVDQAMYAAKRAGRNRIAGAPAEKDGTPFLYPLGGNETSTDNGK